MRYAGRRTSISLCIWNEQAHGGQVNEYELRTQSRCPYPHAKSSSAHSYISVTPNQLTNAHKFRFVLPSLFQSFLTCAPFFPLSTFAIAFVSYDVLQKKKTSSAKRITRHIFARIHIWWNKSERNMAAATMACKFICSHMEILFPTFAAPTMNASIFIASRRAFWTNCEMLIRFCSFVSRSSAPAHPAQQQTICNFLIYLLWLAAAHARTQIGMMHPAVGMNANAFYCHSSVDGSRMHLSE